MMIDRVKIRELMSKKNVRTQSELADRLGITKNQLSVMLSQKFNPIKRNVINLSEWLGVSPMEILTEEIPNDHEGLGKQISLDEIYKLDLRKITRITGIKTLELFAGAGGLALGLAMAGLETEALIEIDKNACETLRKNMPHWTVINDDVRKINFSQYKGKVDVVTGGFPCQAFSYAGKKLGFEDTRGTLFFEFARAIKQIQPKIFVAENVRGLINHDHGRTLATIKEILSDLGYKVQDKLLNAVHFGVPQKRERLIIVGTRKGVSFRYPDEEKEMKTLRDAFKDVPPSQGMLYSENRKKVMELVPPGGCWRDLPLDVQLKFMGKSYYSGGGRTGMARRIAWDEPSLTLTTSPSQKQTERCHPDEVRPFTVREYARIQTFPDSWEFVGSMSDKYKQIGNAVPVKLGYKIGLSIVEAIIESVDELEDDQLEEDKKEDAVNKQLALAFG